MGYYGRLEDKINAQALRRKGFSYKEIINLIPASKDTISRWCRDIKLTKKQLNRLYQSKIKGGLKGSIIGAKKQQERRIKETSELYKQGIKEIGKLTNRDEFVSGVALYAAEGTKRDRRCDFSNSDPKLIKFMVNWFLKYCHVSKEKFRGAIWLHEGLNEKKAKQFWSKLTKIPIFNFHKTYIAKNKINSKKIRKNIHEYGVFSIRISNAKIHRKIMGWIAGLSEDS